MLSETLAKGLSDYAIGEKLRALRLKKNMGLVELGRQRACPRRCCQRLSAESSSRPSNPVTHRLSV